MWLQNLVFYLLFVLPILLPVLTAAVRLIVAFASRAARDGQAMDSNAGRVIDGLLFIVAVPLLIVGYTFDRHGVPGGTPLEVYADTGVPMNAYASLSHEHGAALCAIWALGFFAYWVVRVHGDRLPPIVYACCHALIVLFIVWTAVYLAHVGFPHYDLDMILSVLPLQVGSLTSSLLYIAQLKRSLDAWTPPAGAQDPAALPAWQRRTYRVLRRRRTQPLLWLVLLFPLQLVLQLILVLFGQRPDSALRAFLETSGYHLSNLPAPPPELMSGDGHYLCTVAARGHRRLVKPLRAGFRHGAPIPVNRQLMIANAFEHLLEQHLPAIHRFVRRLYDAYGYPISRHIRRRAAADAVYLAMKPLEWLFLLVLYTCDTRPENRIHAQYSAYRTGRGGIRSAE